MSLGLFTFHLAPLGHVTPCVPLSYLKVRKEINKWN